MISGNSAVFSPISWSQETTDYHVCSLECETDQDVLLRKQQVVCSDVRRCVSRCLMSTQSCSRETCRNNSPAHARLVGTTVLLTRDLWEQRLAVLNVHSHDGLTYFPQHHLEVSDVRANTMAKSS
ncbi:hypothetical protein RRG08_028175 [Elysia crispata]|uniref:Uncharacterized protein n=1 Tax=Elysia crispata TaxID=231223 RepID=A0AAE0Z5T8_9GAST|nr:hypothetical protein RRG08_028175 [Elysia crispata]